MPDLLQANRYRSEGVQEIQETRCLLDLSRRYADMSLSEFREEKAVRLFANYLKSRPFDEAKRLDFRCRQVACEQGEDHLQLLVGKFLPRCGQR